MRAFRLTIWRGKHPLLLIAAISFSLCPACHFSVKTMFAKQYRVGDVITLRLMKKPKGSLMVYPVAEWDPATDLSQPSPLSGGWFSYEPWDYVLAVISKIIFCVDRLWSIKICQAAVGITSASGGNCQGRAHCPSDSASWSGYRGWERNQIVLLCAIHVPGLWPQLMFSPLQDLESSFVQAALAMVDVSGCSL